MQVNPYDVVDPDELTKLRRGAQKSELRFLAMGAHATVRTISVRGPVEEVVALHERAKQLGLQFIGSRRDVEDEDGKEMVYGVAWYELDHRSGSLPNQLGLQ